MDVFGIIFQKQVVYPLFSKVTKIKAYKASVDVFGKST
jgi:hypothetical protein